MTAPSHVLRPLQADAKREDGMYQEVCVPNLKGTDGALVDQTMAKLEKHKNKGSCLFLVDEAQVQIAERVVNPSDMLKSGYHVMYFGTTVKTTHDFQSPAELGPHKWWMYAPSLDRELVRAFIKRVLAAHGAPDAVSDKVAPYAFDYAGASMGLLIQLLRAIVDNNGVLPSPWTLLKRYQPRVVVNGDFEWGRDPEKVEIAETLLGVGTVKLVAESPPQRKALLRRGFLCPLREVAAAETLVPWSGNDVTVTWAHSWQPALAVHLNFQAKPTEDLPAAEPKAPIDAVLRLLPRFPIESLVPNLLKGQSLLDSSEYDFQGAFTVALGALFPGRWKREVPSPPFENRRGDHPRLDFAIEGAPGVWWGVELVVRGRGVKTHVDRFRGSYKNLGIADHLVLDCRTEPLKAAADHGTSKVATISPHVAEGWNVIVLDYHGRRVYVPRDTVPRYVEDWSVADPVVKVARRLLSDRPQSFYCRVELPDKTTVSTDVAATLRKEDLPRASLQRADAASTVLPEHDAENAPRRRDEDRAATRQPARPRGSHGGQQRAKRGWRGRGGRRVRLLRHVV